MNNILVRILIIAFAAFGLYKMFPQISGPLDYYIKNPQFQSGVVSPAVETANKILPEKLQLPTPQIMGSSTEYSSESPLKQITDEISSKAAEIAANQIEQIKKTASDQFCAALMEKIQKECNP